MSDSVAEEYKVETEDLPEELRPLDSMDGVDKVIEYQSPYAEFSVLLTEVGNTQSVRVFYLENLREGWEWVDSTDEGVGFVLLKPKVNE